MKLKKREINFLKKALDHWEKEGKLNQEQKDELQNSLELAPFDWQRLAHLAFFFAVGSIVVAVIAILADDWIVKMVNQLLEAPNLAKAIFFAGLAVLLFWIGYKRKVRYPHLRYANEALFSLGAISTGTAMVYLALVFDDGSGHFAPVVLAGAVVYFALALWLNSNMLWLLGLVSCYVWWGMETTWWAGDMDLFLGMNYPLRYLVFASVIFGLSFLIRRWSISLPFYVFTYRFALLAMLINFWILSIFGNVDNLNIWESTSQWLYLPWSMGLALVSVAAILAGLKFDEDTVREFGVTFLFLNLFSRYVEYGWDNMHKALFFAILGLAFWLIGRKAEKIWGRSTSKSDA